ncbi:MAG: primosomal protein N' [Clostridiales bacterium]|nr:primosomal protein N' [Clostridiales bacterium]
MKYAEIIIEIKAKEVDRVFCYIVPEKLEDKICEGMRVSVPFGRGSRPTEGYVIGISDKPSTTHTLKEITALKDEFPVLTKTSIELAKWMREKYYCTLTDCLQCMLPKFIWGKVVKYIHRGKNFAEGDNISKSAVKQAEVIRLLKEKSPLRRDFLRNEHKISYETLKSLADKNIIEITEQEESRDLYNTENSDPGLTHNPTPEQQRVIVSIISDFESNDKKPFLLRGVTGSGKTLVYTEVIAEALKRGKQAVVLVPEISLTPQTVQRFINRFGSLVTVTHSKMTDGERLDQWKKARRGQVSVMIGPRSAVFAPFDNIGVIIIDEEHEHTYKSEITPKYDAREIAVKLQEICGATVVMGSATPAIESFYRAENGIYKLLELNNRINMKMPEIYAVDMRDEIVLGNKSMFSVKLQNAIKQTLEQKKQIILFLNRRGHSTFVSCRRCGYVMTCESCSVSYTYHMKENRLVCHYCGAAEKIPEVCPSCGSAYIKYFGAGTEKITQEVNKLFPEARVLRMDADTTKSKDSHRQILNAFARGEADILVGTQMIAKGLDFPNVVLVGVVAADLSLNSSDYRSAENTFQLLSQVSGRAGRAESGGKVLIQTYMPENYCIKYAKQNDYISFYREEIEFRRQMKYPPFSHICVVLFSGEDEKKVISFLHRFAAFLDFYGKGKDYEKIGPGAAAVSKIKDRFRHRVIIKGTEEEKLKNYIFYCLEKFQKKENTKEITISVTMNPTYIP